MTRASIRRMEPRDISAVFEVQSHSREVAQWSLAAYESVCRARTNEFAWVADRHGRVLGFLVAHEVAKEMEILNLAVDPAARREGLASALLRHALSHASQIGVEKVFLEVRASNAAAQRFYEAHGFASAGMRPNYYRDPAEDALLLEGRLTSHPGQSFT
ncbi:MAG TPA: ribosomal protein S18-alanine N-acetyltransferase [Candidatus Acidoferrales bacterium]|nr:ribosomal protein S18-alanine N-acetyltransferase [Candidatus Acidoferrales bacterium]